MDARNSVRAMNFIFEGLNFGPPSGWQTKPQGTY
jgi:hypothetical protein